MNDVRTSVQSLLPGAMLLMCLATPSWGQQADTLNGFRSHLPVIPQRDSRPSVGVSDAEQWNLMPTGSVAGFIDSLNPNDAAIQVVADQSRLLKLKSPIAMEGGTALIAIGDPTILDFNILPNPRVMRLLGLRAGVTDLTITTSDDEVYNFEVHVGWDLNLLSAKLRQLFPDAEIKLAQMREHLIVEGQARDSAQISSILETIDAFLKSVQPSKSVGAGAAPNAPPIEPSKGEDADSEKDAAGTETVQRQEKQVGFAKAQIINLMRVPGIQQVMLQVKIAELNRTALREVGADIFHLGNDATVGTQIAGAPFHTDTDGFIDSLAVGSASTAFAVFKDSDIIIRALRRNSILNILAEPNLMAISGHKANFLAGGQFPVPVPQGGFGNVTIQFKDFGVSLNFTPYVLGDDRIRLHVAPEVSSIDFSLGTTIVNDGQPVPGITTRRSETTVELPQGHTLAIAGLLQVELEARTNRIPGLGDLPYIGPMFSNTSHERVEKELVVLVTPYFVAPMRPHEVGPLPGDDIEDPNDGEFYFLNRIEGRTGRGFRSTTAWDDPLGLMDRAKAPPRSIHGPVGHSSY